MRPRHAASFLVRSAVLLAALACSAAPVAALAQSAATPPAAAPAQAQPERWTGRIDAGVQKLEFVLELTRGAAPSARMAIPAQGIKDPVPLKDVSLEGNTLKCTFGVSPMPPSAYAHFTLELDPAGTAKGLMKQGGAELPVTMQRLEAGEEFKGPGRPQHPRAPFPYAQRELVVTTPDGAKLPGTLTIPEEAKFGKGPFPAVLLVTGSGTQNRDEEVFEHKPFLVLADHLTRAGIAVLRVDDRGFGGNADPLGEKATTDTYADDALAGLALLKSQPEADARRLGLVGHSEGGVVAPMAAVKSPDVAFIVMLAGTGLPGRAVLDEQSLAVQRAEGILDGPNQPAVAAARKRVMDLAADEAKAKDFDEALRELVRLQMTVAGQVPTDEQLDAAVSMGRKQLTGPWMRRFLVLDPREALRRVRCPVLVLNGALDTQVIAAQNIPEIAKALMEAANPDVTIRVFPGLNHLFQHARTGAISEYGQIEETMSPEVLKTIADWILARTPRAEEPSK